MKKGSYRALTSLFVVLAMLVANAADIPFADLFVVKAGAVTNTGTIGNITWVQTYTSITKPGTLTITGTGAIPNYGTDGGPWEKFVVGKIIIGSGITEIGNYAFYKCSNATSVTIPETVTRIGHDAFNGCSTLNPVIIPDSVTTIGNYAFYKCTSLKYIYLPSTVTSFESSSFETQRSSGTDIRYGCTESNFRNSPLGHNLYDYTSVSNVIHGNTGGSDYYYLNSGAPTAKFRIFTDADPITVRFIYNGTTLTTVSATWNQKISQPSLTRTGYTLEGCYKDSAFTNAWNFSSDVVKYDDTMIYTKWTPRTYTITYHINGGTINSGEITSYTYGTSVTLPTNVTKTGYKFDGWYKEAELTNKVTSLSSSAYGNWNFLCQVD